MKIAVITDDGKKVSQHFGRATYYLVATVKEGAIHSRELRAKLGHSHFANQAHGVEIPGQPHGTDPVSAHKHQQMTDTITDCEALLCGGMGTGAYQGLLARGIKPVVTDIEAVDQAVLAYAAGTIQDLTERLH